jgi:hypothetical protein
MESSVSWSCWAHVAGNRLCNPKCHYMTGIRKEYSSPSQTQLYRAQHAWDCGTIRAATPIGRACKDEYFFLLKQLGLVQRSDETALYPAVKGPKIF